VVGIVLVSHSHDVAEGAAALAREMGGPDILIETAGGLEGPDHPIGTDAMLVIAAIERAWSVDGVLVLMDLGSAVLSAEMALDLLPEARRGGVLLSDAPFVEGAVAAAVTARMGSSLREVEAEARGGLAAKTSHLGIAPAPPPAPAQQEAPEDGQVRAIRMVVENAHGLHARPAARFVQTASAFDADVAIRNVTAGRGPVGARSLNAVATLGIGRGDEVEVTASGTQALEALDALAALAAAHFGDEEAEPAAPAAARGAEPVEGALAGLAASPGVAIGPARRFHAPELDVPDAAARGAAVERSALDEALDAAARAIEQQRTAVAQRAGGYQAAIFDAHLLFLGDDALLGPTRAAIDAGATAPGAWRDAVDEVAGGWERLSDPYQRARAADLRSVGAQVLAHLLGLEPPTAKLDAPGILIAADLSPADAASLDPDLALGVATAFGGPTSHAAVLARSLGIPAVVGIGETVLEIPEGATIGLDAESGLVHVEPDAGLIAELERRRAARDVSERLARTQAAGPAITAEGTEIEVAANVGSAAEVAKAVEAGCDGVGLFRTEILFLERRTTPSRQDQEAAYRAAAEALEGRPLTIRTLDAGADKPLPFLEQPPEANPFLGVRGIRLGLDRPDLLEDQLRAIVRVAADHPVRVMFPMVATIHELRSARAVLGRALEDAGREVRLEVGVMIEVPSAALLAPAFAAEVDFLSIGTNDLSQYTLAADRGNERVAGLADPLHPAVLQLIRRTADAATAAGRWAGVCGEIAGDPAATPLLLGLGVRELSMSAPAIAVVKAAVRATDLERAEALAQSALEASSTEEVRGLLEAFGRG
jgi:phosphocarrier protein FPr